MRNPRSRFIRSILRILGYRMSRNSPVVTVLTVLVATSVLVWSMRAMADDDVASTGDMAPSADMSEKASEAAPDADVPTSPQSGATEATPANADDSTDTTDGTETPVAKPLAWITGLTEGRRQAVTDSKPILVLATADWCPACRVMHKELEKDETRAALDEWTLIKIDVERSSNDAQQLNITAIPTLVILDFGGQPIAQHKGVIQADDLVTWLKEHRDSATSGPDSVFFSEGKPSITTIVKLVGGFGNRDPAIRHAAVGRLQPHVDLAGAIVLRTLREGALAERLTALELFDTWNAPIEGIDPWRPETVDAGSLARLEDWLEKAPSELAESTQSDASEELSKDQLATANLEIDRMLRGSEREAAAARDRLARFGPSLAETIDRRLALATTDRDRERLRALRYRLASSDSLALRWPGGLERLAATDMNTHQQAAEEFASLATAADQALLLQLFADSDPLVRETGLRGLQRVGGPTAITALANLLSDPEPNVRAAVLKMLEETPMPVMVPRVAKYLKTETDPDLIVHALRFLRTSDSTTAKEAMIEQVDHPSWQVRAEAVAGLGKTDTSFRTFSIGNMHIRSGTSGDKAAESQAKIYAVLIQLLADPDPFVISRAVEGLTDADLPIAVDPLAEAAEKHPELAAAIIETLASGEKMRPKAVPHLRRFLQHEDPAIRAAAITGLTKAVPSAVEKELAAALADSDSEVRTAAATALGSLLNESQQAAATHITQQQQEKFRTGRPMYSSPSFMGQLGTALGSIFGGAVSLPKVVMPAPADTEVLLDQLAENKEMSDGKSEDDAPAVGSDATAREQADDKGAPLAQGDQDTSKPNGLFDTGPAWDRWLTAFREGKGHPEGVQQLIAPLHTMLEAENVRERHAAALALVPLEPVDKALPVLLDAANRDAGLRYHTAAVLPWLEWPQRQEVFEQLLAMSDSDGFWSLLHGLLPVPDHRATEMLWDMITDTEEGGARADAIESFLIKNYLGPYYYDSADEIPKAVQKEAIRALRPRAVDGNAWQRLLALTLILRVSPHEAVVLAEPLVQDDTVDQSMREAAFQVLLAAQPPAERNTSALSVLQRGDSSLVKRALAYLTEGEDTLGYLRFGETDHVFQLSVAYDDNTYSTADGPIVPKVPVGLQPEHVSPWLDHADPEVAAQAGYLLALLGDSKGLQPLLHLWQTRNEEGGGSDETLDKLAYRAIAMLNDSSRIDVLRTIYARLDNYDVREFYWTIRIMSGPEILQFRKEIRGEVGMDRLR